MKYSFLIKTGILFCGMLFVLHQQPAAQPGSKYYRPLRQLQEAIRTHFYNGTTHFYRERAAPEKNKKPVSFLWPLCGLIQAANELEMLGYQQQIDSVFNIIRQYYDPKPPSPGYASYPPVFGGGDRFYDDNQWVGIALMDGYFRKEKKEYLEKSKEIYRFMMTAYDTVGGGGLYWEEGKPTKNTCSNGPGIILALQLYKATKEKPYLDTALLLYNWVNRHLKDSAGLYYDNIAYPSRRLDTRRYSYNTGTMMQSALYLYELTKEPQYLQQAKTIAKAAANYFYGSGQLRDGYWFNAVLLRAYRHLLQFDADRTYIDAFVACIDHALKNNFNEQHLMAAKNKQTVDLTNQAGMLEILAVLSILQIM